MHDQAEGAVFKGSIGGTDYYGVPVRKGRLVWLKGKGDGCERYWGKRWGGYGRRE